MRNRTEHGFSRLTAISDAGSTPAASTILNILHNQLLTFWSQCFELFLCYDVSRNAEEDT